MENLSHQEQTTITRGIIKAAVLMSEHGAESILIEQTAQNLGSILGIDFVEISIIPSAIVLTTIKNNQSVTTTRRVHHKPISMSIVCEIQNIVRRMKKESLDINYLYKMLENLKPTYYNRWFIVFVVGLACGSFSYLQGSDWAGIFITFIASSFAMFVRQELTKKQFSQIIIFGTTAFAATIFSSLSKFEYISNTPNIVIASSVLLLAPGFSLVNSFLDSFKGYLIMGWGRLLEGFILTAVTAIGIILAFSILNFQF